MTMGPPQAEDALRMTLAMGADRAIHLNDRVFAVADTIGTSRTLALAVAKEGADLVLCGRKTVDSETWQVPAEIAAFLGLGPAHQRGPAGGGRSAACAAAGRPTRASTRTSSTCRRSSRSPRGSTRASGPRSATSRRPTPPDASRRGRPPTSSATSRRTTRASARPARRRASSPSRTRPRSAAASGPTAQRRPPQRILELLAEAGDPSASPWEKPERLGEQPGKSYDCWTVVELVRGAPATGLARAPGQGPRARRQARRRQLRRAPRRPRGRTRPRALGRRARRRVCPCSGRVLPRCLRAGPEDVRHERAAARAPDPVDDVRAATTARGSPASSSSA